MTQVTTVIEVYGTSATVEPNGIDCNMYTIAGIDTTQLFGQFNATEILEAMVANDMFSDIEAFTVKELKRRDD